MNKNLYEKLPTWFNEINKEKHYLVLSNDMDSYYSCYLLNKFKGLEIGGFYSFEKGLYLNKEKTNGKEPIFIDISIAKGKSIDNHYTFINNKESINPNVDINTYYKKYNGSTFALVLSLLEIDLVGKSDDYLMSLLAIDGWHIGYYNKNGRYKDINIFWYEQLGFDKILLPILERNKNNDFNNTIRKFQLDGKIGIYDGYLKATNGVELPQYNFELTTPVKKLYCNKDEVIALNLKDSNAIFTSAETYKESYVLSILDKERNKYEQ